MSLEVTTVIRDGFVSRVVSDVDQLMGDSGILESLEDPTLSAELENVESMGQDDLLARAWICSLRKWMRLDQFREKY